MFRFLNEFINPTNLVCSPCLASICSGPYSSDL